MREDNSRTYCLGGLYERERFANQFQLREMDAKHAVQTLQRAVGYGVQGYCEMEQAISKSYFDRLDGIEFSDCTMAKYGLPVRLPVPFAQASQYNYLIATNDYDFDTPVRGITLSRRAITSTLTRRS